MATWTQRSGYLDNTIFKSAPTHQLRHMYDNSAYIRFIAEKSLHMRGLSAISLNFVDVHRENRNVI